MANAAPVGRRDLLRYGILAGLALPTVGVAACTVTDPTIQRAGNAPATTPTPSPSPPPPTPLAGSAAGAGTEATAVAWCTAVAGATSYRLAPGQLTNLTESVTLHRRRLEVLSLPEATTRPPSGTGTGPGASASPPPSPAAVTLDADRTRGMASFRSTMDKLTEDHLGRTTAVGGATALLWASLAAGIRQTVVVADRVTEAPRPAAEPSHGRYVPLTDVAAAQGLLAQLHALVFGLQACLAPLSGAAATPYQERLVRARIQRDHLVAWLRTRGSSVPAAEPQYDLGGTVTTATQSYALVARMESALLPFAGDWVAASETSERRRAAEWLVDGAGVGVAAGAAPAVWPGWRD